MCAGAGPAMRDPVSDGENLLELEPDVGKSSSIQLGKPTNTLWSFGHVGGGWIVIAMVASDQLVDSIEVAPVEDLLEEASDHRLVALRKRASLGVPRRRRSLAHVRCYPPSRSPLTGFTSS